MRACGPRELATYLCRKINTEREETNAVEVKFGLHCHITWVEYIYGFFMPFELHEAGRRRRSRTICFCVSRTCSFAQTIT